MPLFGYTACVVSTIACYISGHGLGHAVRVIEVLRAMRRRRPELAVTIRTPLDRWFFDFNLRGQFRHGACRLDIGAVQADSLSVDPEASLRAYAEIAAQRDVLVATEVSALAPRRPELVLSDIPALAFEVARSLGVPSVAMTNFSWDWIYADYVRDFPHYTGMVADLRASYARSTLLLRLPMHGDLSAFPRVRDIPLVARVAGLGAAEVRRRLDLPARDRVVLLSFGGLGVALRRPPTPLPGVTFVSTGGAAAGLLKVAGCRAVSNAQLAQAGVRYEDLVGAADAVMTKPGYGIVAECIANGTPMVYTSRGRFAEYACLVEGIRTHLEHAFISNEDLHAGRWSAALESVLAPPRRPGSAQVNGAAVAAEVLLGLI